MIFVILPDSTVAPYSNSSVDANFILSRDGGTHAVIPANASDEDALYTAAYTPTDTGTEDIQMPGYLRLKADGITIEAVDCKGKVVLSKVGVKVQLKA